MSEAKDWAGELISGQTGTGRILVSQLFFLKVACIQKVLIRVSIQGVKLLLGDRLIFPRLGPGDTDRWQINLYAPPVSIPNAQSRKNNGIPPKVIYLLGY